MLPKNIGTPSSIQGPSVAASRSSVPMAISLSSGFTSSFSTSSALPPNTELIYSVYEAPQHQFDDHVEGPGRIPAILQALSKAGLIPLKGDTSNQHTAINGIYELPSNRIATDADVSLIHTYLNDLQAKSTIANQKKETLAVADLGDPDGITFLTPSSLHDALTALGSTLALLDAILRAENNNNNPPPVGFAIIRPPGHHATPTTPLGYCLLNNVAIAAKYAQKQYNELIKRVMIFDFDVHNGNGTCEAFWEDSSVLVIDAHEDGCVYPAPEFIESDVRAIGGEGDAKGTIVNIPMPRYASDKSINDVFDEVVVPITKRYDPDLILVSAGYDAHVKDPFQLLQYTSSGAYYQLGRKLKRLADEVCRGRLLFALEGGYDVESLGESVRETWLGILDRESSNTGAGGRKKAQVPLPQPEPLEATRQLIQELKEIHELVDVTVG